MANAEIRRERITKELVARLPTPQPGGKLLLYDDSFKESGLGTWGITITPTTASYFVQRRVAGRQVRATIDRVGRITVVQAKKRAGDLLAEMRDRVDPILEKRKERDKEAADAKAGITFEKALEQYVKGKRRKDGLTLKARTVADYLATVAPGGKGKTGKKVAPGVLHDIAGKPVASITADKMRELHRAAERDRGPRAALYAVQVLRAVLRWHGVVIAGNPLGKDIPERDRIVLPSTSGNPHPIPAERLGAWWKAALRAGTKEVGGSALAGDYYRFRLLTGCRGVEIVGDAHNPAVTVGDLVGSRIVLKDTKNRKNFTLLLSTQALEIAQRHAKGRKAQEPLFDVGDGRKTLQAINVATGMEPLAVPGHGLRSTFANIAKRLVPYDTLKGLLNHSMRGDVTGESYLQATEEELREGWQRVADAIERAAGIEPAQAPAAPVVQLPVKRRVRKAA